ncbi:hypothetical protein BT96DRAFT_949848 [Gymnopus androsaceus JB14]|uniref:Uncharacterized protein n=1 Tax=Gymnopus androsaceus JB14 TaxID=1447944 RepID=A0A6A4GIC0_9AGAR|nr:hypothetical protein BT96DRAFT_949848 [Gymnopus androsaceus JB14]
MPYQTLLDCPLTAGDVTSRDISPATALSPPGNPPPAPALSPSPSSPVNTSPEPANDETSSRKIFKTESDELGLFKIYRFSMPSRDPTQDASLNTFVEAPTFNSEGRQDGIRQVGDLLPPNPVVCSTTQGQSNMSSTDLDQYGPFENASTFLVTDWAYRHDTTSVAAMDDLVHNVILNSEFNMQHLASYSGKREAEKMDNWSHTPNTSSSSASGSATSSPCIPFSATAPDKWSTNPSSSGPEHVIAWIQLWSDSTHLAEFGTASLWPIYLYFGNLSKYTQGKSKSHAAHHLAYIPSLPDLIKDIYKEEFGTEPTDARLLLDDGLIHAYVYGILILCADGILRLIFPRFFSYSMDYPEQILLACIKYLADCLCPRCTIRTSQVSELGQPHDMQRRKDLRREDSEEHQSKINIA